MNHKNTSFIAVEDRRGETLQIAYHNTPARDTEEPGLVWFPGLRSNMNSTKVNAIADWAARSGRSMLRFDYSGHGQSDGAFAGGTISQWLGESLAVLGEAARGPQILVGSSMGGWLVLLLLRALARGDELTKSICPVAGAVLIAPAWDMTEELMWKQFTPEQRKEIETRGFRDRPSRYGDGPYRISRTLIEDGRAHLLGGETFTPPCPVRIIQGMKDQDVPWRHVQKLTRILKGENVTLELIRDGDHRLSRPRDIEKMLDIIDRLYKDLAGS